MANLAKNVLFAHSGHTRILRMGCGEGEDCHPHRPRLQRCA
jgi:hypothetical protein